MGLDFDFSRLDAQDVLDLAIFVEDEAKEAYEQLVAWMKNQGNLDAAEFFARMARLEELHGRQIADLRHSMFGNVPPRHTRNIAWEVEAPDFQAMGKKVSLQDALLFALGAETRAWDYYNGALEYVHEPEVVRLLEGLRDAEKEHQRLLEREMAKAT